MKTKTKPVPKKPRKKKVKEVEPTYRFVKDVGWVPTFVTYPEISKQIGKYMVTLAARNPEVGEFYFEDYVGRSKVGIEKRIMKEMQDPYWKPKFEEEGYDELTGHFPVCTRPYENDGGSFKPVVITVKAI